MIDVTTQMQMREMHIQEMLDIVNSQERVPEFLSMPFETRFQHVVSDFYSLKMKERNERLVKRARIKYTNVSVEDILYTPERCLDRNMITQLSTGNYISFATNVAIYGPTRTGKTFIASVLANISCHIGRSTFYVRMPDLLAEYACKETARQKVRFINKMERFSLLVLDDWLSDTYSDSELSFLFEVFEKREGKGSTILCSQFSPITWRDRLGCSAKAESMLSRIMTGMCTIECKDLDITKLDCCKVKI